jgi:hypothetical protein
MVQSGFGEQFDRQAAAKRIVIAALGRNLEYGEAAALAGVSERTIGRWRKEDRAFDEAIREQRERWVNAIVGDLAVAGREAVAVLRFEARFGERSADRVRASVAVLHEGQRFRREVDFEVRMRAIEERLGLVEPLELGGASDDLGEGDDDAGRDDSRGGDR